MTDEGDNQRAAAICEQCGSGHVVRVRPDGSVRVIGTSGTCACGGSDYHILGSAGHNQRDATDTDPSPVESRGT